LTTCSRIELHENLFADLDLDTSHTNLSGTYFPEIEEPTA
jgi:hypothetical protein